MSMIFPIYTVNTVGMVPETGIFVALKEGLWRFTFVAGDVIVQNSGDFGNLYLQVDGTTVASSSTQNR